MKRYKFIIAIVIGLLLIISIKAHLYHKHKRLEHTKQVSPKYDVASQSRQGEEKYWEGD